MQLQYGGQHIDKTSWKPASTSKVVSITYCCGRRQGVDFWIVEEIGTINEWKNIAHLGGF